MRRNASPVLETTGTTDRDAPYTTHYEPAAQGGEKYVRCTACGRELLASLGGRRNLLHAPDCPHGEGRR